MAETHCLPSSGGVEEQDRVEIGTALRALIGTSPLASLRPGECSIVSERCVVVTGLHTIPDLLPVFSQAHTRLGDDGILLLVTAVCDTGSRRGRYGCASIDAVISTATRCGFVEQARVAVLADEEALDTGGFRALADTHGALIERGEIRLLALRFERTQPRWRVANLEQHRRDEVAQLFERCFGFPLSLALWDWKYGAGRGENVLGLSDERVVAHYGATYRRILYCGEMAQAAQIGDVMVDPSDRGVLTRRGPFYLTAATQAELSCATCLVGFGFPNTRAMRLPQKLGLYAPVDRIVELAWPVRRRPRWKRAGGRIVEPGELARMRKLVDRLWSAMAEALTQSAVGVRDIDWLTHRYADHPVHQYTTLVIRSRFSGRANALAVVKREGERCELLDVIGPAASMPDLITVVRHLAACWGCKEVYCWITESHAQWLDHGDPIRRDPDVVVPTSIWVGGPSPDELQGRWWLMGGDTDFH